MSDRVRPTGRARSDGAGRARDAARAIDGAAPHAPGRANGEAA
jgi:hypothetical protein